MGTLRPMSVNVVCPRCGVLPGAVCVDLRYLDRHRPIAEAHPSRVELWLLTQAPDFGKPSESDV